MQVVNGATFVNVDVTVDSKSRTPMLVIEGADLFSAAEASFVQSVHKVTGSSTKILVAFWWV